jgi:formylglycine-generating enzyme required for sulfatase activity
MPNFFLNPFLESIKDDIPICVRDYERITLALQSGGEWTVERLKDVLLALLVKNKDQQRKFLRRFDAFFPADAQTILNDQEISRVIENIETLIHTPKPSEPSEPSESSNFPHQTRQDKLVTEQHKTRATSPLKVGLILGCLVLVLCAVFGLSHILNRPKAIDNEPELPTIVIEPATINFGVLKQGKSAKQTFSITNTGPGTAIINSIKIVGENFDQFKIEKPSSTEDLDENEKLKLKISYEPQSKRIHNAFLVIECNAKNSPVRALLKGQLSTAKQKPTTETAKRIYRNMPYVEKVEYYDLPEKPKDWIYFACAALLFLLFTIVYAFRLYGSRRIPEDKPADFDPEAPRRFSLAAVLGRPSPILSRELLDHLADCMGYFKSEQSSKNIDVDASVKATVKNCGIPAIVFSRRKQVRALLVLEDIFAESSAWNTVAAELVNGMQRRGVPVIHANYDRSPAQFKTKDGKAYHLEDLEDQSRGFLVLIFAENRGRPDRDIRFALERLGRWPMKAWLDYKAECVQKDFIDDFTTQVQKLGIPVFPASSEGIYQAVKKFISEQGSGQDLAQTNPTGPDLKIGNIPERPDAYVEYLLKDALPWAQDCAMMQPMPVGLADALRKKFHPHLPPERLARLFALPDTINTGSGLRFKSEVQAILRKGFIQRRTNKEQEAVLLFIADEIKKAEPKVKEEKPGLDHLKWEALMERLNLELKPDNNLERFAALTKSPLGSAMLADLETYDFEDKKDKIPLRLKPKNQKALQRLADMAGNPFHIPKLKAFPLMLKQWVALGVLILCFLGFSGVGLYDYSEWLKSIHNWEIIGDSDLTVMLEIKQDGQWVQERSWQGEQPGASLLENTEYRMTVYEKGYRSIKKFESKTNQKARIYIKREDKICDCKEELPAIGLTVLRCSPDTANNSEKQPAAIRTWKEILGNRVPKDRLMSIGLEFLDSNLDSEDGKNSSLAALHKTLLETGSLDILYQIRPGANGKWNLEELFQTMQRDISPWIKKSQLILWHKDNPLISQIEEKLPKFERLIKITFDEAPNWAQTLTKLFEQPGDMLIKEKEILASLLRAEVSGKGEPLALIRANKEIPPGTIWTEPITGMEFVWVPPGCYQMGSNSKEADSDEKPVHEVCVDGFWIAKYEVTQGQYKKIMGSNPSRFKSGENYPVESVSWDDAKKFIAKFNEQSGKTFKLPTEAQWEYAARSGGKDQEYAGGNDVDKFAWYDSNSGDTTHTVGTKASNGLGIYDMSGNVWEWCEDVYDDKAYKKHQANNPVISLGSEGRVLRGGSWFLYGRYCRSASRIWYHPASRNQKIGFRLAQGHQQE